MANRKLHFINPNTGPLAPPTKTATVLDILRTIMPIVAVFALVTIGCAALYYVGARHGWGIKATFQGAEQSKASEVGIFDCLYFSIITISTLGYGDYRPESYGRLIAGIEVVAGIILVGFLVSRLVSRQQDRFTQRLVRGHLNSEIQSFRDSLAAIFQSQQHLEQLDIAVAESPFLHSVSELSKSIARYWRSESQQADLDTVIPFGAARRLLGDLVKMLETVLSYVDGRSPRNLLEANRTFIRNATESALLVAGVLADRVDDDGVRYSSERICELVEQLRAQLKLKKSIVGVQ